MSTRQPTPPWGARVRATGLHGRLVMDEIGNAAIVVAALLALFSALELVLVGLELVDEFETGATVGDAEVQLYLLAAFVGLAMLVAVVLGTWFMKVWVMRVLVVLHLIGVVFAVAATGSASPFAIITLLLAGALWIMAEVRWTPGEDV